MPKIIKLLLISAVALQIGCAAIKPSSEQVGAETLDQLSQLRHKADGAYKEKDYVSALEYYQSLEKLIKNDAQLYFRLGNTHSRLHQPDLAIVAYKKSLLLNPRLSKAWHNMGVIQLRQSANTWVQMVSESAPDDPLLPKAEFYSREILRVLNSEYQK